jgi:hypothetical protein
MIQCFHPIYFCLDVVPQQFSRQNSSSTKEAEEERRKSISDIPTNLPSVRELACKFLMKRSPEPMPRKSVKVSSDMF